MRRRATRPRRSRGRRRASSAASARAMRSAACCSSVTERRSSSAHRALPRCCRQRARSRCRCGYGPHCAKADERRCGARVHYDAMKRVPRRTVVLGCVMLALFMAAVEVTIVATALPQIVGKLGGFSLYTWVFSGFLLTQASTILVFGKLADLHGRRPVLIGGIVVFLIGSTLCGFAWSMPALIAFRLLQGLGAGSIQPVAATIVGDLYTPQERPRVQGWLSSVWGFAAIVGPLAGGLIVEVLS